MYPSIAGVGRLAFLIEEQGAPSARLTPLVDRNLVNVVISHIMLGPSYSRPPEVELLSEISGARRVATEDA